jgi:hypothetical protein
VLPFLADNSAWKFFLKLVVFRSPLTTSKAMVFSKLTTLKQGGVIEQWYKTMPSMNGIFEQLSCILLPRDFKQSKSVSIVYYMMARGELTGVNLTC